MSIKNTPSQTGYTVPYQYLSLNLAALSPRQRTYVDDPLNASMLFERFRVCGQVQSYVRPLDCGATLLPRARMEMRGSGPNRLLELESSPFAPGFPDPVSLTVCPYLSSDLLTFPALSARLPLRRPAPVLGRLPCSSSAPRRCAPFDSPTPPQPAYAACAPAYGPAMSPAVRRAGPPSAPPSSRL